MQRWLSAGLVVGAVICGGQGGGLYAKAWLAQELVARAWERTLVTHQPHSPWPWADTRPVARLRVPRLKETVFVLAGSQGRTLAFGPGHVAGTAAPGEFGNSVLGGHRDTHFGFLRHLQTGDLMEVETTAGSRVSYRVLERSIVDREETSLMDDFGDRRLTLVTCYPFSAVTSGGRLRFVVTAVAQEI